MPSLPNSNDLVSVSGPNHTGGTEDGSGYLIGDGYVLTAGHIVYDWDRNPSHSPRTFDSFLSSGVYDYKNYADYYRAAVDYFLVFLGTSAPDNPTIESAITPVDSVLIHQGGNVDATDDGLVTFLDQNDLVGVSSSVAAGAFVFRRGETTGEVNGSIISGSIDLIGTGSFQYTTSASQGDSGGAYLLRVFGKNYVIGTQSANFVTSPNAIGNYLSKTDWDNLNAHMETSQSNDVTLLEPQNMVVGTTSADTIMGSYRSDRILGRGGNDTINDGDEQGDTVWANDILIGGAGSDTFQAGAGSDTLWGGDERSDAYGDHDIADYSALTNPITVTITGFGAYAGITVLDGLGGTDDLHSIEEIDGTDGDDRFNFGGDGLNSNINLVINAHGGQATNQVLNFGSLNNGITTTSTATHDGQVVTFSTGGTITLNGFHTNIIGTNYDDSIEDDSTGAKTILGRAGNDTITVSDGNARIDGGAGNDTLTGGDGNDVLFGGAGHDVLNGGNGSDYLDSGDDTAWPGGDELNGGAGDDYIHVGLTHNAVVNGGAGDDVIDVASLATVQFGEGDGHDVVIGDGAHIDLTSLSKSDVHIIWNASVVNDYPPSGDPVDIPGEIELQGDLVIIINATGDSIVLQNISGLSEYWSDPEEAFSGPYVWLNIYLGAIVEFSDGTLSPEDFTGNDPAVAVTFGSIDAYETALVDAPAAGAPDPSDLTGDSGDNTLQGGWGDDELAGDDGDDSFYASGGHDTVDGGSGNDILNLYGAFEDYSIAEGPGNSIVVTANAGLDGTLTLTSVESIHFAADDQTYTIGDLLGYRGTSSSDVITATDRDNQITGLEGADTLSGGGGNDSIDGGDGNDTLNGQDGDDYLIAGAGDNTIDGGAGNDTLDYSAATAAISVDLSLGSASDNGQGGTDTISGVENVIGSAYDDTIVGDGHDNLIVGGAGDNSIDGGGGSDTLDYSSAAGAVSVDLSLGAASDNGFGGTDTITNVENLVASSWGDTLTGDGNANHIAGGAGDDTIDAGGGNDVIVGSAGTDTIDGGSGTDTLNLDGYAWVYSFTDNHDGTVTIENLFDSSIMTVTGIEQVYLTEDNYTSALSDLIPTTIDGTSGNDSALVGTGADNQINGLAGDDSLQGGGGNDVLDGGDGDDVAEYAGSSTDYTVYWGSDGQLYVSDMTAHRDGYDTLLNIESVHFSGDSVTIDPGDLAPLGTSGNDTLTGTDGNDNIIGNDGDDIITAYGGIDWLEGDVGNDTYIIGTGTDSAYDYDGDEIYVYNAGSGSFDVRDYGGSDVIQFGAGIDPADVTILQSQNNLIISFADSDATITIWDGALSDTKIEQIQFADSTVWNL